MLMADDEGFGRARHTDPQTSQDAAAQVDVNGRQKAVLDAVVAAGTASSWDVAEIIHLRTGGIEVPSNCSPRLRELQDKGFVKVVGKRKSPMGRSVQVYAVTGAGLEFWLKGKRDENGI